MIFQNDEVLKRVKCEYPIGSKVELVQMNDPQAPPVGTKGTVIDIDDVASLIVKWDNGCGLYVVYREYEKQSQ